MALLPQELSRSEEWFCLSVIVSRCTGGRTRVLELPSNDITPLVQLQWQISVRLNPLGVVYKSAQVRFRASSLQGYITVSEVGLTAIGSSRSC